VEYLVSGRQDKGYEMKIELTQAVIECLKRGLNCWPQQNFADGAEIRDILRMNLRLVEALASQAPLATTHYEGCYDSGPKHYECALLEVKRLRGVESLMREKNT
tara:strand:- start:4175 stop:4486 length:312 start_codon:yes stop_codon:yes gene_type:complete